ncbi:nonribosomal peptide synthase [Phlyctema vagabunda]|uniref:Nonribosomal peptide synthase n=1 Tax=Phlyctema vagabunda TaxID=108571 RepID=A0ABR4PFM2_9HELO
MDTRLLAQLCAVLSINFTQLDFNTSFIQNGGDSLKAVALAAISKSVGCELSPKAILTSSSLRDIFDMVQVQHDSDVTQEPRQVQESLQSNLRMSSPTYSGSVTGITEDDSLTEFQLLLIHGSLKYPGLNTIVYNETYYADEIPRVKEAWKTVIEMEVVFQTPAMVEFYGEDWKRFDWRVTPMNMAKPVGGIGYFFEEVPHNSEPGYRDRCTIVWTVHHSLIDGYSASLLFDKVRKVASGMKVERGPPFSQVVKDLKSLQISHREAGDTFWQQKLQANSTAKSELLLPRRRFLKEDITSGEVTLDISDILDSLVAKAREINVTLPAFFNAAWALVLSTYADSDSVVFGAVMSGRTMPLPNVSTTIGPLVNTLPLFVNIQRSCSVDEYVRSVFLSLVELEEFQWTTPLNGFSRNYHSALAMQFGPLGSAEYAVAPLETHWSQPDTEIPVTIAVHPGGNIQFRYHHNRFSEKNMQRLAQSLHEALQYLLRSSTTVDMAMQSLLSCPSQALLMRFGNCVSGLTTKNSVQEDLVTLFERITLRFPAEIAVEMGNSSLTYQEFDCAASRLALELTHIITPGDTICVHSDRSINWLVGIFGIIKAGAVYCSLDIALAPELRNSMYLFSGAKAFLTSTTAQLNLAPISSKVSISVEDILNSTDMCSKEVLEHRQEPLPWATAYLIFTSGSTGVPKLVSCTHAGLVAFQSDMEVRLFAQPGMKIAQIMSAAFDGSIHEIFSALTYGATLVLPNNSEPFDHLSLVDSAILTPSIARVLHPNNYERLKFIYLVGEAVPQSVADKWAEHKQLYNMYGPTEGTCGATIKRLEPGEPVTIGCPNPTTRIYLLNSRKALVQPGMIGEIYLAGVQVANGYLNLNQQNKERFLLDSICCNGERMYKTGDRGYWSESGEIICLGRNDREIKLRGYRLDMNDLEIRIANAVPELEAIAIARNGDQLIGMIQPHTIDVRSLSLQIAKVLPPYAVPQQLVPIDQLPMTAAGKVDYAAVSRGCVRTPKSWPAYPKTGTEKKVAAAFRHVLGVDDAVPIFASSSFVELGGHSLQQLLLAKSLSKVFQFQIPLRSIIEHETVAQLSRWIDEHSLSNTKLAIRGKPLEHHDISPIEREWLQKYAIDIGPSCFNVCFASAFDERVDRDKLAAAWNVVLDRHKILRCRYIARRGKSITRSYIDIAPRAERVQSLDLWTEVNRPFQVDKASPIRVFITNDKLIVILSHIVADYTTLSILLREASTLYNGYRLSPILQNYCDAKVWFEDAHPCYLDFWANYLKDPAIVDFGMQQERAGYQGESLISVVDPGILREILDYCETAKVTLQQLAMAAVAVSLDNDRSKTDIVLGSPYINRKSDEDFETVGLFLEPLPVRIRFDPSSVTSSIQQDTFMLSVQKSSQAALAHAVPWHRLLEHLSIDLSYPTHPLFEVMVTFHDNRRSTGLGSTGLEMSAPGFDSCFLWSEGAKFKLMCEFTAVSDSTLLLRLEYDAKCVPPEEIRRVQNAIPLALSLLVKDWDHTAMKSRIFDQEVTPFETINANSFFGRRMCDLT